MDTVHKLNIKLSNLQQRHYLFGFTAAVIKKYNSDNAGLQSAILTYYSFLSVFPMLLILTTFLDSFIGQNSSVKIDVLRSINSYFPLLGSQLSKHIHSLRAGGLALLSGLVFLVYGARGVASAFTRGVQAIWEIPEIHRPKPVKSFMKSVLLVIIAGSGFMFTAILSGLASSFGKELDFRVLSIVINLFLLFWLFRIMLDLSLPKHIPLRETRSGAIAASISLVIVQLIGSFILSRELKHLNAVYSYFAVALGLIFWIYFQAKALYISIEIALVSSRKSWLTR